MLEGGASPEELAQISELLQKFKEETAQWIEDAEKKKVYSPEDMEAEESTTQKKASDRQLDHKFIKRKNYWCNQASISKGT